jgi:hypothetical protein
MSLIMRRLSGNDLFEAEHRVLLTTVTLADSTGSTGMPGRTFHAPGSAGRMEGLPLGVVGIQRAVACQAEAAWAPIAFISIGKDWCRSRCQYAQAWVPGP